MGGERGECGREVEGRRGVGEGREGREGKKGVGKGIIIFIFLHLHYIL